MANMLCRTKGNANPKGKPRVYFTCHPEDFEKYFDKVCEDIFKTHDCAIYYTEDMSAPIAAEDLTTDLGSNNLFVIPVTFKLLTQPNRAMDRDFPYALAEHIPVLPIVMESGIDAVYSKPDKFGALQYLYPFSSDATEISYEEKLKKHLESVLISDELANRIRAAFDAYIFLSYRKKDRRYANELMRLIHSNPKCRDIAIWYDEFLTPGESFRDSIDKILHDSKLFTLLVTPNLLEEPDGKPNFVMAEEYPAAKASGIDILPAEMEPTDKEKLSKKFLDIPDCVDIHDETAFHQQFLDTIQKIAVTNNDTDPMHNFLIGLAYLDGIDVEVDRQRGLELITSAAEADLPEAMEKMFDMYNSGIGAKLDYHKAFYWATRLAEYSRKTFGEEHAKTLVVLNNLALAYGKIGNHTNALELIQKVYTIRCNILGQENPNTILSAINLAHTYIDAGKYDKALEFSQLAYDLASKTLEKEHTLTRKAISMLAATYGYLGCSKKALPLNTQLYEIYCKLLGAEHPDTLVSMHNLAFNYIELNEHHEALELQENVYRLRCKVLGEEHPDTLVSMHNLASTYSDLGNHEKAREMQEKVYALRCKVLGATHPDTLSALHNLAFIYDQMGNYAKEAELEEIVYSHSRDVLGEEHPHTIASLNNLAYAYFSLDNHTHAAGLWGRLYTVRCKVLGEEHPDTLTALLHQAYSYGFLEEHDKAVALLEHVYTMRCKVLGPEHPDTIISLSNLAYGHRVLEHHSKTAELLEILYSYQCKHPGCEHPDTIITLNDLAFAYGCCGNLPREVELLEQAYALQVKVLGEHHPDTITAFERWQTATEALKNL